MPMNLYNSVYQLLKENDCVIIPDFGGFVANYFEAKIDFPTQEFYPPEKKIAFNQDLRNNDGLLINDISNSNNIDWSNAENIVKKFVDELNYKLKENKYLEFGELGSFALNNDVLIFTPNKNLNLLEGSYGLKAFSYPMIGTARKTIEIQKPKELSKTKSAKLNKKKRRLSPAIFYTSSAAIIAGLLFVAVQYDWIRLEKNPNHQVANIAPVELLDSSNSDKNSSEVTDDKVDTGNVVEAETIEENTTVEETVIVPIEETVVEDEIIESSPVSQNLSIHIIGGSFGNRTNAESYQNELIDMGYDSQILPTANGMFRVTVKSFAAKYDADKELSSLRNSTGNSSLWVLNW